MQLVCMLCIVFITAQNSGHIMARTDFIVPHYGNQNEYVICMVIQDTVFKWGTPLWIMRWALFTPYLLKGDNRSAHLKVRGN